MRPRPNSLGRQPSQATAQPTAEAFCEPHCIRVALPDCVLRAASDEWVQACVVSPGEVEVCARPDWNPARAAASDTPLSPWPAVEPCDEWGWSKLLKPEKCKRGCVEAECMLRCRDDVVVRRRAAASAKSCATFFSRLAPTSPSAPQHHYRIGMAIGLHYIQSLELSYQDLSARTRRGDGRERKGGRREYAHLLAFSVLALHLCALSR